METDIDKIQYTTPDSKKENRGLPNVGKKVPEPKKATPSQDPKK